MAARGNRFARELNEKKVIELSGGVFNKTIIPLALVEWDDYSQLESTRHISYLSSHIHRAHIENEVLFGNQVDYKNWIQRAFKISTIIFNNSFASFHDSSLMRKWIIVTRWFPGNPRNDKLKSGHHPFGT